MLKDNININQSYSYLKANCSFCGNFDHCLNECDLMTPKFNRSFIIAKYQQNIKGFNIRRACLRRFEKTQNSMYLKKYIEKGISEFVTSTRFNILNNKS